MGHTGNVPGNVAFVWCSVGYDTTPHNAWGVADPLCSQPGSARRNTPPPAGQCCQPPMSEAPLQAALPDGKQELLEPHPDVPWRVLSNHRDKSALDLGWELQTGS